MAWGYKNGLGVQEWPGGTRIAWGYKNSLGIPVLGGTRQQAGGNVITVEVLSKQ